MAERDVINIYNYACQVIGKTKIIGNKDISQYLSPITFLAIVYNLANISSTDQCLGQALGRERYSDSCRGYWTCKDGHTDDLDWCGPFQSYNEDTDDCDDDRSCDDDDDDDETINESVRKSLLCSVCICIC